VVMAQQAAGLSSKEAEKQIQQMVAFIRQEAREKAEEIAVKTESDFMAEKLTLHTQAGVQIREEFEKRKKDMLTEKKIAKSKKLNGIKFDTMRKRDGKIKQLKDDVTVQMADISKNAKYPELIRFLLIQGLMTMMEPKVTVQCRQEDVDVVEKQVDAAVTGFQQVMQQAAGVAPPCQVTIDKQNWLPPGPRKDRPGLSCCGGVLLTSRKGKIVCRNTLDHRLELSFHQLKPLIRRMLFGSRAAPPGSIAEETDHLLS